VTWVASLLKTTFLEVHVGFGITIGMELSMDKAVRLMNVVKRTVLRSLVGGAKLTLATGWVSRTI